MKKGIIGVIIALVVAGGAYATYHAVDANSKTVTNNNVETANNVVTTQHQNTTPVAATKVQPTNANSDATKKAGTASSASKQNTTQDSTIKQSIAQTPKVDNNSAAKNTSTNANKNVDANPDIQKGNNQVVQNQDNSENKANQNQNSDIKKQAAESGATTVNSDLDKIKALPIYKTNAKYKNAVDQMYQLLTANNLQNNEYMYQICSQPEQYKNVQTEGLMGMVTLKVTKNQDLMQKIVNQYGWIQASVLNN